MPFPSHEELLRLLPFPAACFGEDLQCRAANAAWQRLAAPAGQGGRRQAGGKSPWDRTVEELVRCACETAQEDPAATTIEWADRAYRLCACREPLPGGKANIIILAHPAGDGDGEGAAESAAEIGDPEPAEAPPEPILHPDIHWHAFQILEALPDPIWVKDRKGRYLYANPAALSDLGCQDPVELFGRTEQEFRPPETVARHRRSEQFVLRTGKACREEWPRLRDGRRVGWMSVSLVPLCDRSGEVAGVIGQARDISDVRHIHRMLAEERRRLERLTLTLSDAKREAERTRDLLRAATSVLFDGFALFDPEDRLVLCNESFADLYGAGPEALCGLTFEELQRIPAFRRHLDLLDDEAFEVWLQQRLLLHRQGSRSPRETRVGRFWFLVQERRLADGFTVLCRADITPLKRNEAELREVAGAFARAKIAAEEAHELLREATGVLFEGFALFDSEGALVLCNGSFAQLFGEAPAHLEGRSHAELCDVYLDRYHSDMPLPEREAFRAGLCRSFEMGDGTPREMEAEGRWYLLRYARMSNGFRVLLQSDISHLKRIEEELKRLATTDELTELRNRRFFFAQGRRLFERYRQKGEPIAVLLFDLDHFKRINDEHGHDTGDAVLRAVSICCQKVLRPSDLVARIGGEEFAVLLPGAGRREARRIARRLCESIRTLRIPCGDGEIGVTASIGIATPLEAPGGLDHVLAAADAALYEAKRAGRNRVMMAGAADTDKADKCR